MSFAVRRICARPTGRTSLSRPHLQQQPTTALRAITTGAFGRPPTHPVLRRHLSSSAVSATADPATTTAMSGSKTGDAKQLLERPNEHNSVFFLCDVQETFRKAIDGFPQVIGVSKFLCSSAQALGIPIVATEQDPFKPTVAELQPTLQLAAAPVPVHRKSLFSMLTPAVRAALKAWPQRRNVYLFGIEAHVCVLQTTLDLLRDGYRVFLVADAVSSQRASDRAFAFARLSALPGVVVTTSESAIYELCADAKHPAFKPIVGLVKELAQLRTAQGWKDTATAAAAPASTATATLTPSKL